MSKTSLVSINQVTKKYPRKQKSGHALFNLMGGDLLGLSRQEWITVLDGVSFSIGESEVVSLIGPNGAGKTTLLKILGGVSSHTSGVVKLNSKLISVLNLSLAFDSSHEVEFAILVHLQLYGIPTTKLDSVLTWSGLQSRRHDKVEVLSSGMKAKLALAIVFTSGSQLIVLDEVLAVGDARLRGIVASSIDEHVSKGGSVIIVSHDMAIVREMATRALVLYSGKLVMDGSVDDGIDTYFSLTGQDGSSFSNADIRLSNEIASISQSAFIGRDGQPTESVTLPNTYGIWVKVCIHERAALQLNVDLYGGDQLIFSFRGEPFCCFGGYKSHEIRFWLDDLMLSPGRYRCRVSIYVKGPIEKNKIAEDYLPLKFNLSNLVISKSSNNFNGLSEHGWAVLKREAVTTQSGSVSITSNF